MSDSSWFVMLAFGTDDAHPVPVAMTDGDDDDEGFDSVALFDTEAEAYAAGMSNPVGKARGFEVYEWPWARKP